MHVEDPIGANPVLTGGVRDFAVRRSFVPIITSISAGVVIGQCCGPFHEVTVPSLVSNMIEFTAT